MKNADLSLLTLATGLLFAGCNKGDETNNLTPTSEIITSLSSNVIVATYDDLASKAYQLELSLETLKANPTTSNLENARQLWKETRSAWEQSEGFLFGPVSSEDIDPGIDTWPVNFLELDSLLASSTTITPQYLAGLTQDALRGFHPLEYILWGQNGNKLASELTEKEMEYMVALGAYIRDRTSHLSSRWDINNSNSFRHEFEKAGNGSSAYSTRKDAMLEVVSAMQGICEEVADGKIEEPFFAQDPSLEESPFSGNSIADFTNNMRSIENMYVGKYASDGKGIQDFVKNYNLSLDAEITQKIAAAIAALQNITVPFGEAILTQPQQVANAQTAIRNLNESLEKLTPLIQQRVTD
ncbi:MAG: hypothetical protein K1X82_00955 [Bacteroidia bacterium]|nr:hypothetical protein [Bacteroidia bacterium]